MKYTMIGVDLAKNVFQLHGASLTGEVRFRRKLSRGQFLRFMGSQPACIVVMEACGSAHHWAREMAALGHEVKLIAPQYVRPFVKRQKNDAADAEAIVIAARQGGADENLDYHGGSSCIPTKIGCEPLRSTSSWASVRRPLFASWAIQARML